MAHQETQGSGGGLSRREFLKATGVVGAGLVLAPTLLTRRANAASNDLNIALIGAGTQAQVLMEQVIKIPGVKFKAVCDIWPYNRTAMARRLKAYKHDVTEYTDYEELLEKEKGLDAVIVATPDWKHAEHAIACMKAGLNVYCEKEMSNDLALAKQMVVTSRETKKLLQIGHQRRSNPRYIHAKKNLLGEAKLLNRITHIYGQWNRSVAASGPRGFPEKFPLDEAALKKYGYDTMERFRDWRWFKKFGGGPIADLGSHQIDIFGWFLGGVPKSVIASGGADYYKNFEWYDNAMAIYEFDTPQGVARAYYQVLSTTGARGYFESFMGVDGTLQISEDPSKCRLYAEGHLPMTNNVHPWNPWVKKGYLVEMKTPDEPTTETKSDVDAILGVYKSKPPVTFLMKVDVEKAYHQAHLENFFDAVRAADKAKLNCPGEAAYETAVQVLKVNEAIATGKPVLFKEEDFKA
jgi:predicted dehydrogenase